MTYKPYAQMTPRERLIDSAAGLVRHRGVDPHLALEATVDGARPGTYGGEMLGYYRGISQNALERLIKAVEREARHV